MKKRSLSMALVALVLMAAVSCKKDTIKTETVASQQSAALQADSNLVSFSAAGIAAVNNANLVIQSKNKAVNSNAILPDKRVLDSLAVPSAGDPSYYIFNYEGGGFAMISADNRVQPILAYSETGYFSKSGKISAGLGEWLSVNHKNMQVVRKNKGFKASKKVREMWADLKKKPTRGQKLKVQYEAPTPVCEPYEQGFTVGPLLQTTWGQGTPYNYLCPTGSYSGGHMPTGCVATAMAQVAYYWQYGSAYSWSSMPLSNPYPSVNYPLAQLMLDAGASVNMSYHDDGSYPTVGVGFVYVSSTQPASAFKNYFHYGSANHDDFDYWDVKGNLNNHWPVILTASTDNNSFLWWSWYFEGHTWVCDGYSEYWWYTCETPTSPYHDAYGSLLFHMNWGWDGYANGYYYYNVWDVFNGSSVQHYYYNQSMDYNIHP